jgi:hypothetical protein
MSRTTRWLRDNGLTLVFLALLFGSLLGQLLSGVRDVNAQQIAQGGEQFSVARYAASSNFLVDVAENWQSEYLQFALYILATVWLVQRGSSESKVPGEQGTGSDQEAKVGEHAEPTSPAWARAGGLRTSLYGRSLGLIMAFFFFGSLLAQSIAGRTAHNADLLNRNQNPMGWWGYVTSSDFWNRALQNWQSEFLAIASMAAFSIYLRQRGSPESKVVGAPHDATEDNP